jgi:putative ATP-dependent endonuclease of the OLD family
MRISRIQIDNFRNFHHLELHLGPHAVIVGENKIGKSNLIQALRLVLDPRMSEADRRLRLEDFWDGLPRPLTKGENIHVSVDLTDFEDNKDALAVLAEHVVEPEPMVSRLTYLYRPLPHLEREPQTETDYEFIVYGGDRPENQIGFELRKWIPLAVLPALRNGEDDLANWRSSPLAPLLRAVAAKVAPAELERVAHDVSEATAGIANLPEVKTLGDQIKAYIEKMIGPSHAVDTSLGFSPTDQNRLIRGLRLFIDEGKRGIADASLGCANLIYLSLLSLDLERQVIEGERSHTFLAIEEPEAHLHPHLQRLVFREYLEPRITPDGNEREQRSQTILLTTHSPYIVSVAPLKSIVILKKSEDGQSTVGSSAATLEMEETTIKDLERYLDVSRGECVFAKGILLVEGPAEEFLLPVLGKLLGFDFDQLGITVCSVNGTNFMPYVKLFGPTGFNLPFAILTDLDPQEEGRPALSIQRVRNLFDSIGGIPNDGMATQESLESAKPLGCFVNNYTLEVDMFRSGLHQIMTAALIELSSNGAARDRAHQWGQHPDELDPQQFLIDITEVGKGRYAQRLASALEGQVCPDYIREAIEYVAQKIR